MGQTEDSLNVADLRRKTVHRKNLGTPPHRLLDNEPFRTTRRPGVARALSPRRNDAQWWALGVLILLIVFVWPPQDDKSLATKFVNWVVDPRHSLPTLPD